MDKRNSTTEGTSTTEEWKPTKTPNKRAAAVKKRLPFLHALYNITHRRWTKLSMWDLKALHRIGYPLAYLYAHLIVERKGNMYRWIGPEPSAAMAHEWCDHVMAYNRIRNDSSTVVKEEMQQTFDALTTADKRLDRYSAGLAIIYKSIHCGYRKRSLTKLCDSTGLPNVAGRLLIERGMIDRPRHGNCKWIGPPPDRDLVLWLYGKLAEHHRAIYRSDMEKKEQRTAMIDEMVGRNQTTTHGVAPLIDTTPTPQEDASSGYRPYWHTSSTSW